MSRVTNMPPIRSPRRLYKINLVQVNNDDDPTLIDRTPGVALVETKRPIIVKMKEGVGQYLGLTPLNYNDPELQGIFGGIGLNLGQAYNRRVGGFKTVSFTLYPESLFQVREKYYDATGVQRTPTTSFKSITIGFPKGPTVLSVKNWLATCNNFDQIRAFKMEGRSVVDLYSPAKA